MGLGRERADFGRCIARMANADGAGSRHEGFDEAIRDAALDENARSGEALLAVVGEDTDQSTVERGFEIGVVEDDVGGFAAQFHHRGFQGGAGGGSVSGISDQGDALVISPQQCLKRLPLPQGHGALRDIIGPSLSVHWGDAVSWPATARPAANSARIARRRRQLRRQRA